MFGKQARFNRRGRKLVKQIRAGKQPKTKGLSRKAKKVLKGA